MKGFVCSLVLVTVMMIPSVAFPQAALPRVKVPAAMLAGRWQVKFTMAGLEKNLVFEAKAKGSGSLRMLDTGIDDKPVPDPQPAAWSSLSNDRVSFSGETELPIGNCCREIGTLIFKGRFISSNSISGRLIFVTSVDEEESPYKLRSIVGTFTATRMTKP